MVVSLPGSFVQWFCIPLTVHFLFLCKGSLKFLSLASNFLHNFHPPFALFYPGQCITRSPSDCVTLLVLISHPINFGFPSSVSLPLSDASPDYFAMQGPSGSRAVFMKGVRFRKLFLTENKSLISRFVCDYSRKCL